MKQVEEASFFINLLKYLFPTKTQEAEKIGNFYKNNRRTNKHTQTDREFNYKAAFGAYLLA